MPTKDLTFRLLGQDSTATLALRRLSDEAGKTAKHFEGAFKLAGAAVAGVGLAGMAAVGAIVKTGIGEAMDASAGMAQLQAGIKSTGGAAGVTVGHMENLASSIQSMSGQTDDSVVKAEQLLLTFTNIRNKGPNKIFDQATQAAADMAAKMGGDASTNAIRLGKALNDPVKGISALSKVGVSFTAAQKAQVAAMVKSGDTMGAQKLILGELNKEFGGAAKAAGESLPGQLQRAQRAFEDMSQTVVETILPVVTPAIGQITAALRRATPFLQAMARTVATTLKNAFTVIAPIVANFGEVLVNQILPAVSAFAGWMAKNKNLVFFLAEVIGLAIVGFKTYVIVMQVIKVATLAWAAVQAILNGTLALNPIGLIVIAVIALIAVIVLLVTHWSQVCAFLKNVWGAVCKWFGDTLKSIGRLWDMLWRANQRLFQTVWHAITGFFRGIWNGIVSWFVASARAYVNFWRGIWNSVVSFFQTAIGRAVAVARALPGRIMGFFRNAGTWLLNAGRFVIDGLIRGIQDSIGNVVGAVSNIAGNVIGTFKNILGIHSPSTVFHEHGQNIVQGLINGITGNTAGVHKAVAGLVPGIGGSLGVNVATAAVRAGGAGALAANRAGGVTVNVTVQGAMVGNAAQFGQYVVDAIRTGTRQGAIPKNVLGTL